MESWRQEAYEAMGLSLLQPRFVFPAARPGCPLVTSPAPQQAVDAPQTAYKEADAAPAFDVAGLASDFGVSAFTPDSNDQATDEQAGATLRFRLRLMRFGPFLMVMDQPKLQWEDEEAAKRFFADIHYFVLGRQAEDFQDQVFNWPPVKQFPLADDIDCARQTVSGFVKELIATHDKPWLLLWGEQLAPRLLSHTPEPGEVVPQDGYRVLQLQPLSRYWNNPASKQLLWQYLQPIRKQHHDG